MNRKDFLLKLKNAAKDSSIKNYKELLNRYERRFDLAKEAGFSEEEACEKFGDVDDIVEKYSFETKEDEDVNVDKETKDFDDYKNFTVDISLISDHVNVQFRDNIDNPVVDFNDANPDDYTITSSNNFFKIGFTPRAQFLTRWRSNNITISIPNIVYKEFKISVVSGVYNLPDIRAKKISIKAVSGNYNIDSIYCDVLNINLVSGRVNINTLDSRILNINDISGKINISDGKWEQLNNHSVSGHLNVDKSARVPKKS